MERGKWLLLFFIFGLIIILNIPAEFLDFGGDSAQYIILAESIVQGKGYRAIDFPGEPFFYHYPPVFPLLLTPILHFWGRNFVLLHLWIAFLGFLSLSVFYRLFIKHFSEQISFIIVLLIATNPTFILYSATLIRSEIPYILFSGLTLLFFTKYIKSEGIFNKEGIYTIIFLLLSYFTRYVGISLFLGLTFALFVFPIKKKTGKLIFVILSFLMPVLIWNITSRVLTPEGVSSYVESFFLIAPYRPYLGTIMDSPKYLFFRFLDGVNRYVSTVKFLLFPNTLYGYSSIWYILGAVIFIFILSGIAQEYFRKRKSVCSFYFLSYFVIISLWPFGRITGEGIRFLLPLLPFMYFYLFLLIKLLTKTMGHYQSRYILSMIVGGFLFSNIFSIPFSPPKIKYLPKRNRDFLLAHIWIKRNLPPTGVILSRKPTLTYFYTGHKAIGYPYSLDSSVIWREVVNKRAEYIVVDSIYPETDRYLGPFLYDYAPYLQLLYRVDNTAVFKIKINVISNDYREEN